MHLFGRNKRKKVVLMAIYQLIMWCCVLSNKWEFLFLNDFIMDNVTDYGPGTMGTVKLILDLKLFKNPSKMIYYKLMQPIQYSVMRQLSNSWNWNVELIVISLHRNDFELKMHFPKL